MEPQQMERAEPSGEAQPAPAPAYMRFAAALVDAALLAVPVDIVAASLKVGAILTAGDGASPSAGVTPLGAGVDALVAVGLLGVITVACWSRWAGTPGKKLLQLAIVDQHTGCRPSLNRLVQRYLYYFVAALPLGLGFLWACFDARRQGLHDKMAYTLVVAWPPSRGPVPPPPLGSDELP